MIHVVFEVVWREDKTVVNIAKTCFLFTAHTLTRRAQGRAHSTSIPTFGDMPPEGYDLTHPEEEAALLVAGILVS